MQARAFVTDTYFTLLFGQMSTTTVLRWNIITPMAAKPRENDHSCLARAISNES
jgi:hypothetical protein